MKKLDIKIVGHGLVFHREDGWDEDLLESILSFGEMGYTNGTWRLKASRGEATLNFDRLSDLAGDLYRNGAVVSTREREHALKYYSQVGIFEFGDRADSYGRNGRGY